MATYKVVTEDGYTFIPLKEDKWGDKDIEWNSYDEMINHLKKEGIKFKVYSIKTY